MLFSHVKRSPLQWLPNVYGAVRSKSEIVWDFIDVDVIYRTLHWKYDKYFTSDCSEPRETTWPGRKNDVF